MVLPLGQVGLVEMVGGDPLQWLYIQQCLSVKCISYECISETDFLNVKEEVGTISMDVPVESIGILQLIDQLEDIVDRLVPGYEIHVRNILKYLTYW